MKRSGSYPDLRQRDGQTRVPEREGWALFPTPPVRPEEIKRERQAASWGACGGLQTMTRSLVLTG